MLFFFRGVTEALGLDRIPCDFASFWFIQGKFRSDVLKALLKGFGHTLNEASDYADAVAQFANHKDAVPLLISDVIMPRMNSIEAYTVIMKK